MTTIFEAVKQMFEAEDYEFHADAETGAFGLGINAPPGVFTVRVLCEEEAGIVHFIICLPVHANPAGFNRIGRGLHMLNARARVGCFVLDYGDGEVAFKLATSVPAEDKDRQEHLRAGFHIACGMLLRAYAGLTRLLTTREPADDVIRSITDFEEPAPPAREHLPRRPELN